MTVATLATATSAENRRAVVAGTIGNVLEWYDFGVYGYLATTMSQLFFPGDDKTISLLKAFAVFGVGFVMRPVGSILFGVYGDRFGRRLALSAVIFLMAFSTVAIGLLPTYAQAGVLAPILLVVFRLLQGLSAGGEWGGSTSYIVEYAQEGRRGFIGSWQQVSVGSGFLLGSLSAALLSSSLSPDAFISWGWRVPFLLGIFVGVLGAYLRWRLNDTPKFTEIAQHGEVAKAPLIEAFTAYRREALTIFGLTLHNTVAYYITIIYVTSYIVSVAKLAPSSALWIGLLAGLRDFDPDLGRIIRSDWSQAAADVLLRWLYHPRLSAFHDGVLGERHAGVDRPDGDDRISIVLFRRVPRGLFRTPPDPRALHCLVNRIQHRGGGVRRVRALHRDLADRCDRQQFGTILLSHRGGDDHVPRRAQNPRDGVQAFALICSSADCFLLRRMSRLVALFGRASRANQCPVSGVKQPCRRNLETAEFDPA